MTHSARVVLAGLATLGLLGAGCGSAGPTSSTGSAREGSITVSAATSLSAALTEIGERFEAANPGIDVSFNFAASSTLAAQILDGAPADVFASADEPNMTEVADRDLLAGEPAVVARNELVIVTKPGNPTGITSLADLADGGVISMCGEEVPCGRYARQALDRARVSIPESKVTRGQNVDATLTAVTEGDAVAGIVYATDAMAAGDSVDAVAIPADHDVVASYPIAILSSAGNPESAGAFVSYVLSEDGRAILEEHGFLPPA